MRTPASPDAGAEGPLGELSDRNAAADALGARLLAPAGVGVQRAALDGLVDQRDERAVLRADLRLVARGDGGLQPAEVRLDLRRVVAVLEPLTLRPLVALDLGLD